MFFLVYYYASSDIHTVSVMPSSRAEPLRKKSRNLRWASRYQAISIESEKLGSHPREPPGLRMNLDLRGPARYWASH